MQLAASEGEHRRHRREIGLARRIQVALLPSALPSIPGYALHAGNRPSEGVSGDYYEVLTRNNGAEERLEGLCLEHRRTKPSDVARALETALKHFTGGLPPDDDRTLVIVKRDP